MTRRTLFEACVESLDLAIAAEDGGADRIELCADLSVGGLTPEARIIRETRKHLTIPIHVLIRPRAGDFCYSAEEFDRMKRDISTARDAGIDGVVLGILNPDLSVDTDRSAELLPISKPISVTFHRAFDEANDPLRAVDDIASLGIERLLTSGQRPTAEEGMSLIRTLMDRTAGRLTVMPGGGVNKSNALKIISETGATELHGSLGNGRSDKNPEAYSARVRDFVGLLP